MPIDLNQLRHSIHLPDVDREILRVTAAIDSLRDDLELLMVLRKSACGPAETHYPGAAAESVAAQRIAGGIAAQSNGAGDGAGNGEAVSKVKPGPKNRDGYKPPEPAWERKTVARDEREEISSQIVAYLLLAGPNTKDAIRRQFPKMHGNSLFFIL